MLAALASDRSGGLNFGHDPRCDPRPGACPDLAHLVTEIIGPAHIIDGDTLIVTGQRIRLADIDAPEVRQPCYDEAGYSRSCGMKAVEALADKITGRPVSCEPRDVDRYGRIVATCSIEGDDLGRWLVSRGRTLDWPRYSDGKYSAAQAEAKAVRRGIWRGEFTVPREWRQGY